MLNELTNFSSTETLHHHQLILIQTPTRHPLPPLLQRTVIVSRHVGALAPAAQHHAAQGVEDLVETSAVAQVTAVGLPLPQEDRPMLLLCVQSNYIFSDKKHPYESQQAPNPSNVLGVFGLSIRTQERDLDEEFSRFGRVEKVTIVYDQRVGPFVVAALRFTDCS